MSKMYYDITFKLAHKTKVNQKSELGDYGLFYEQITLNLYKGTLIYIDTFAESLFNSFKPMFINIIIR